MSRVLLQVVCAFVVCLLLSVHLQSAWAAPQPQIFKSGGQRALLHALRTRRAAELEADDLDTGAAGGDTAATHSRSAAESDKDDLEGSSSYGYGYYSYPYFDGFYGGYGGYYPYYSHYYGLGYPYYLGGYYGGYHGYHSHYF